MLFIVLDADNEDVQRILPRVDDSVSRDDVPLIYFVESDSTFAPGTAPQRRYRLDTRPLTITTISMFIHDVLYGNVKVSQTSAVVC